MAPRPACTAYPRVIVITPYYKLLSIVAIVIKPTSKSNKYPTFINI